MSERGAKIAKEFESVSEYEANMRETGYARYSYQELMDREAKMTPMIEGASDVALFNSGAAAMHTALAAEGLRPGDHVVCARSIFATTKKEIERLVESGIQVTFIDTGDREEVERIVRENNPRLFVAESIANSTKMEMLDMAHLGAVVRDVNSSQQDVSPDEAFSKYASARERLSGVSQKTKERLLASIEEFRTGNNPFIFRDAISELMIETSQNRSGAVREVAKLVKYVLRESSRKKLSLLIDNTLPSPHLINPLKIIGGDVEKVIIESGTKHYQEGANEITLGIAYSDDPAKVRALKEQRIALGTYLQPSSENLMPNTIGERMPKIMESHARNALHLAETFNRIPGCDVSHPNLPQHANGELATQLAPQGSVTLFYVTLPEGVPANEFMQQVKDVAGDRIGLGTSFGHSKTWLSNYGLDSRTVRVAAGSEPEEESHEVASVFLRVLSGA